jgi:hypothetical protein
LLPTLPKTGAVVLSNGDARIGTYINNTQPGFGWGTGGNNLVSRGPVTSDTHLSAAATASGYAGLKLLDIAILEFDITPTISGPLAFKYVFGSEEYPKYAPTASKWGAADELPTQGRSYLPLGGQQ